MYKFATSLNVVLLDHVFAGLVFGVLDILSFIHGREQLKLCLSGVATFN